ncbi:MAG: C40 family peptidase [Elusimicrobiota bacterium]
MNTRKAVIIGIGLLALLAGLWALRGRREKSISAWSAGGGLPAPERAFKYMPDSRNPQTRAAANASRSDAVAAAAAASGEQEERAAAGSARPRLKTTAAGTAGSGDGDWGGGGTDTFMLASGSGSGAGAAADGGGGKGDGLGGGGSSSAGKIKTAGGGTAAGGGGGAAAAAGGHGAAASDGRLSRFSVKFDGKDQEPAHSFQTQRGKPAESASGPVLRYASADTVDVFSDMEGLESDETMDIDGKEHKLATQLMTGEAVEITGPSVDGMMPVFIPGQNIRGWVPEDRMSGDASLAASFPVRRIEPRGGLGGADPLREAFVKETAQLEGVPYKWGGRSPRGVDCSGMVQLAASYVGMGRVVPRTSRQQKAAARPVNPAKLEKGDLVFTSKTKDRRISHVVVYIGDGMIREAPQTGSVVQSRSFARRYGFSPEQAAQGYDHARGFKSGKYYVFFGSFFE